MLTSIQDVLIESDVKSRAALLDMFDSSRKLIPN